MTRWRCPVPCQGVPIRKQADLLIVACTVLGEAEGEGHEGQLAVAWAIVNRAMDSRDRWPKSFGDVALQPKQFSCWNAGSPRLKVMLSPMSYVGEQVWNSCFWAAAEAIFSIRPDVTHGANHYLNPVSCRKNGKLPAWYDADKITATIGAHEFLQL